MREKLKSLRGGVFSKVLVVEALILVLFGIFLTTRPVIDHNITVEEIAEKAGIEVVDGAAVFSGEAKNIDLVDEKYHLGGYEINIDYELAKDEVKDEGEDENEDDNKKETPVSNLKFINMYNQSPADSEVTLSGLNVKAYGRLYVNYREPLSAWLNYGGNRELRIYSVRISENVWFRAVIFTSTLLLIGAIDAVYVFYKTKKISKEKKKVILGITLISLVASIAFFSEKVIGGHDTWFHLERIASVSSELSNGNFPVRMMTNMLNGHGYPNSIFYCDIFLYIPAILYMLFVPLGVCYQIYGILISVLTCVIAFYALKRITNNDKASLAGATLYTLSIYRLTNVFLRGAVGEYTAMMFIPLIILGLYKVYTEKSPKIKDWAPLGLGFAGLAMCHVATVEICLGFTILLSIIMFKKTFKKERFLAILKAILLCVGLSLWFVVPFLDYTLSHSVEVTNRNLSAFNHYWGLNLTNYLAPIEGAQGEMPFGLGLAILAGILITIWLLIKYKNVGKKTYKTVLILTIFGGIALFIGSYLFPWEAVLSLAPKQISTLLTSIQFPFRFMMVPAITFSFAIAIMLPALKETKIAKYRNIIGVGLISVAILNALQLSYNIQNALPGAVKNYASVDNSMIVMGGEYVLESVNNAGVAGGYKAVVDEGKKVKTEVRKNKNEWILSYKNGESDEVEVALPIYAYKYFEATNENGEKIETFVNENQLIMIKVPGNSDGEIKVRFNPPMFWHVAEVVSLLTLVTCVCYGIYVRKR